MDSTPANTPFEQDPVGVLSARLRHELGNLILNRGSTLVISVAGTNRYVQFYSEKGLVAGESVSNQFLSASEQLTKRDEQRLIEIGWNAPTYLNYWQEWHDPVPVEAVVELTARTLIEIHRAAERSIKFDWI